MQGQQIKANNLPYIQVLIYNKPTQFVVDTGASRGIWLAPHANDIEKIATNIDYDPVSISGLMTISAECIQFTVPGQFNKMAITSMGSHRKCKFWI